MSLYRYVKVNVYAYITVFFDAINLLIQPYIITGHVHSCTTPNPWGKHCTCCYPVPSFPKCQILIFSAGWTSDPCPPLNEMVVEPGTLTLHISYYTNYLIHIKKFLVCFVIVYQVQTYKENDKLTLLIFEKYIFIS